VITSGQRRVPLRRGMDAETCLARARRLRANDRQGCSTDMKMHALLRRIDGRHGCKTTRAVKPIAFCPAGTAGGIGFELPAGNTPQSLSPQPQGRIGLPEIWSGTHFRRGRPHPSDTQTGRDGASLSCWKAQMVAPCLRRNICRLDLDEVVADYGGRAAKEWVAERQGCGHPEAALECQRL